MFAVCLRVMNFSPIRLTNGKIVGYPSLCADVHVDKSDTISDYFLMLTGVGRTELTKDIIQYFCTNHARHMVQQVYFTKDENTAILMFSADVGDRVPGVLVVL